MIIAALTQHRERDTTTQKIAHKTARKELRQCECCAIISKAARPNVVSNLLPYGLANYVPRGVYSTPTYRNAIHWRTGLHCSESSATFWIHCMRIASGGRTHQSVICAIFQLMVQSPLAAVSLNNGLKLKICLSIKIVNE